MTSENGKRRVYTKRTLAQRAAEAQDKATRLQAAAERQRTRCLVELGGALLAMLKGRLAEKREGWIAELSKVDIRNQRRRAEAISWLKAELGVLDTTPPTRNDMPAKEFQVPAGVEPPKGG